jgi:hypothetical protein
VVRAVLPPLAVLLGYGIAFASAALGASLLAYDDHPGQLYRLWHVVTHGFAPWAWNAGWWGGYPELQFYPPGFAYAGALLHHASFGLLSVPAAYQALLWLTYLAPGVTTFFALARVLESAWLALPGAFVALTLSAGVASGVEGGLHIGMVAARLGWALLPLLVVVLGPWIDGRGRLPWLAVPVVAAVVLTHPAHLPTAVAVVALAGMRAEGAGGGRLRAVASVLGLAAATTAFWTLPLLVRVENTRALAWGRLSLADLGATLTKHPLAAALPLLAACALSSRGAGAGRRTAAVLARLPWVLVLVVAADAMVVEPLGARWLPADRVVDGAWLAFILAAGLGAATLLRAAVAAGGRAVAAASPGAPPRLTAPPAVIAASLAAVIATAALGLVGGTLTLWPRGGEWPSYAATARGMRLDDLWRALAHGPPGRVLFVRSGVPLVYGTDWWRPHTHITSLTPLESGRPILNGTFTHPSPIAALVYRGDAGPGPITRLVEQLDGHSLFGRPLEALVPTTLAGYADRLGISAVVALEDDRPRLRALDEDARFARPAPVAPFVLYARRAPVALPEPVGRGRWRAAVDGAPGAWVPLRMAYYPLWRAEEAGTPLETRRGPLADLEVKLRATPAVIDLLYAPGLPEVAGVVVSALAVSAWLVAITRSRLTRARARG